MRKELQHYRGPHCFVPLVRKQADSYCSLDILFLRRDSPGSVIRSGGDLDNRLKVLLDALKVPDSCEGLPESPEYDPIYCLLQDDDQITKIGITTDRILTPIGEGEKVHDVLLVIHVYVYRSTNAHQVVGLPSSI